MTTPPSRRHTGRRWPPLLAVAFLGAHGASVAAADGPPSAAGTLASPETGAGQAVAGDDRLLSLERSLASERLRCATLEAEVGRLKRAVNRCAPEGAEQPGTTTLAAPDRPAVGAATNGGAVAAPPLPSWTSPAAVGPAAAWSFALLLAALLGVVSGFALADWLQRRRHGGFRV